MEMAAEKVDWSRAPANTPVCEDKGIYLRDIVQAILDIFVPVINAWKSGVGCGGGCEGCAGGCAG